MRETESKSFAMASMDLSARFEKISDRARAAADNLKGAEQRTNLRLEFDAGFAQDRATAAALRLSINAAAAGDRASSQWQEVRDEWATYVANVRGHLREKKGQLEADVAASDANMAEDYALDAIDFAAAAIDQAESAVLGAMYARASADTLGSWPGE
jgi:hypothetical protein